MKKKILTLSFCLASLGITACAKENVNSSSPESSSDSFNSESKEESSSSESSIERKETNIDTVYEALTTLKEATSYKSSFSKEGLSTKTITFNSSYVYSSKTNKGHILLSGFKADQDKASFSFSLSGSTISVSFADMSGDKYLSSLDSFIPTKNLSLTKEMLELDETSKKVLLKDATSCSLLLDIIGGQNEDNPYSITSIEIYFNRYNELVFTFYEGESKVDEAVVTDINSATEKTIENYLLGDGATLLKDGSLTKEKMTNVLSDDLEVTSKIQKTVTSIVSDDSQTYLRKSANKIYRYKADKNGEITEEQAFLLDEDECFTEYYLGVDNKIDTHYNEDDYWTDVFDLSSVDPELFKKGSGNNYDYYGGEADTILGNLINDDAKSYGEVTSLYALVKDGQVKSFTFTLDEGYIVTSTFALPAGEVPSISPKERVSGVGDRLEKAFNNLAYSKETNGFSISMNTLGHGSEYNTVEGIYTKDVIMNYRRSITNADTMRYEGMGYQVRDDKLFAFNVGGSESGEGETLSKTYSFSGTSEEEGTLSTKWFNVIASPDVFYKKAGTENTFVMYKGLLNYGKAFPVSLSYGETITDISLVLDSSDKLSEVHLQAEYNGEEEGEYVMKFTYGSETSPILSSDVYTKLDEAYNKMNEASDFTGIKNVYNTLHEEEPDHAVSDEILKDIPFLAATGANSLWVGAYAYDYSSWSTNYSQFTITLNFATLTSLNVYDYFEEYIALLDTKTNYSKSSGSSTDGGYYKTSETYTNSDLKYSLSVKATNDDDYGEYFFEITVDLL